MQEFFLCQRTRNHEGLTRLMRIFRGRQTWSGDSTHVLPLEMRLLPFLRVLFATVYHSTFMYQTYEPVKPELVLSKFSSLQWINNVARSSISSLCVFHLP